MDIFDLSAKITLDSSSFEQGVNSASSGMDGLSAKAVALGNALYDIGKKAVSAFGEISKAALEGYANYEQLTGGIETLFGDASDQMMRYAKNAFKTAGMSANEYMETAIGFSAALINSVSGDTKKAADLANRAITDMSDNANKMGTTLESLQNAYTGFSRGNFTMLDNLALGFAGTKEGMQQLLDKAQELSGIEFDISSYADIVEAIHIVQTEMGITGTTAAEAAETISGSVASMKSAWENWLTGLGNADADMSGLTNNLTQAIETMWSNLQPTLETIGTNLMNVFQNVTGIDLTPVTNAFETVKTTIATSLSEIKNAFEENGIDGVFENLVTKAENLTGIDFSPFVDFLNNFKENSPEVIESVATAVGKVAEAAGGTTAEVIGATAENTSELLQNFTDVAADRITDVADGVGELADVASENKDTFATLAKNISDFFAPFTEAIVLIVDNVTADIVALVNAFTMEAAENTVAFADAINKLFDYLQPVVQYMEDSVRIITDFIDVLKDTELSISEKGEAIGKILAEAAEITKKSWEDTFNFFKELPQKIYDCFAVDGSKFIEIGHAIVEGIISGVKERWGNLTSFLSGLWEGLFDQSKKDNKINSPSKLYATIGEFMARGVGVGWDGKIKDVQRRMKADWKEMSRGTAIHGTVDFASSSLGKSSAAQINTMLSGMEERGGNYNINLVVDGRTLASVVFDPLNAVSKQKGVALGA